MMLPLKCIHLLLIDDDEDDFVHIRDLVSEIRETQHQIHWASNYEDGLNELRKGFYHACLLDYRLGMQTGLDLLREAQRFAIECPIILLTGHGDVEVDIEAMKTGAADYLVKSDLTPQLLGRSIRYTIKQATDVATLREQTENFKTLFNSTFEGIVVQESGVIVDANTATGEVFGLAPTAMIGTELSRYFRFVNEDCFRESLLLGNRQGLQLIGLHQSGNEFPIEIFSRQISLNGRSLLLTTVQDLTIKKQMEAQIIQQDRLASLGLLASSLAHEIGTPMGVIRGRAEMLMMKGSEDAKRELTLIISQIDRITKLMNSVLQLARGNQSNTVTDVDLLSVVNDVLHLLSHEFMRKKIHVDMQLEDVQTVRAESGPLGQVLLNLLVNSIHAIEDKITSKPEGDAIIKISMSDEGDGFIKLLIYDSGCGISEENLSQLFKPFFTTKGIGLGTGLGLAISAKIVQSWGGSIRAESRIGHGTTFSIKLRK